MKYLDFLSTAKYRHVEFFISEDGRSYTSSNCGLKPQCTVQERRKAIQHCEQRSKGSPCFLFSNKTRIFWENSGNFMPFESELIKKTFGFNFYLYEDHPNYQYAGGYTNTGFIQLSLNTAKEFEYFLENPYLTHAYISDNGKYLFVSDCLKSECTHGSHREILYKCKSKTGVTCSLFARKDQIIWHNAGNFMPFQSEIVKQTYGHYFFD